MTGLVQHEWNQRHLQGVLADLANPEICARPARDRQHITDVQGNITHANDRFCEISGYSRQNSSAGIIASSNRVSIPQAFYEELWATIASGQVWRSEMCNRARAANCTGSAPPSFLFATTVKPGSIRLDSYRHHRAQTTASRHRRCRATPADITNTVPGVVFQWEVGRGTIRYTSSTTGQWKSAGWSARRCSRMPSLPPGELSRRIDSASGMG